MNTGISIFELIKNYNLTVEEAQKLQMIILMIIITVFISCYCIIVLLKMFCPKLYGKLKNKNII